MKITVFLLFVGLISPSLAFFFPAFVGSSGNRVKSSRPSYGAPKPRPAPAYKPKPQPSPAYNAPLTSYTPPKTPAYKPAPPQPPKQAYSAPAPKPAYNKPTPQTYKPSSAKPSYSAPKPLPPKQVYKPAPPKPVYSAPRPAYSAPARHYKTQSRPQKQNLRRPAKPKPARRPAANYRPRPPVRPIQRRPSYPGAGLKLDYSGWKPINFDESLPGKLSAGTSYSKPDVITVDHVIKTAPEAESDDTYSSPPLPPAAPPQTYYASTSAPVVLPNYTPSPQEYQESPPTGVSEPPLYESPDDNPTSYNSKRKAQPLFVSGVSPRPSAVLDYDDQEFPIISLITADSDVPEAERYVSFSIAGQSPPQPPVFITTRRPGQIFTKVEAVPGKTVSSTAAPPPAVTPETIDLSAVYDVPTATRPAGIHEQPSVSPVSLLSVYDIAPGGVQSVSGYSQVTHQQGHHHQQQGYQSTANASNLAEDVSSGAVYVQQTTPASDELYYIYYQDPDKDPLYGKKVYDTRAAAPEDYAVAVPETLDASHVRPGQYPPVEQLPLYDYDTGADLYRGERNNEDYDYSQQFYNNYRDIGGQSSVSFNLNVGGKNTGYNYNL